MFNFISRLFYPVWSSLCFGVETVLGKRKRELCVDINSIDDNDNSIMDFSDLSSSPELQNELANIFGNEFINITVPNEEIQYYIQDDANENIAMLLHDDQPNEQYVETCDIKSLAYYKAI